MPASSRPPWLLFLSGFGVAGSVLGAVVAAFALGSGVIAFGVWPADPAGVERDPLTLDSIELGRRERSRDRALVLPALGTAAASDRAATSASTPSDSRRATTRRRARASSAGGRNARGYSPGPPTAGPIPRRPGNPAPETPSRRPLAPVGGAVDDTTRAVGDTVRSVTRDLGNTVGAISPPAGAVVANAGAALATTVQNLGSTIAALLGHARPAPQRPQPGH